MVADMMSSFDTKKSFYEFQNYIIPATGRFQIWKADDVTGEYTTRGKGTPIKPGGLRRHRSHRGAGLTTAASVLARVATGLSRLPNATLIGFYGTNGLFGMVGDGVLMPGGQQMDGRSRSVIGSEEEGSDRQS